jgi:hypothetical protein
MSKDKKPYFICEVCEFEDRGDEFGYCPCCTPEQLSEDEKGDEPDNGKGGHCYFLGVLQGICRLDGTVCEYKSDGNYEDCPKIVPDHD